MKKTKRIVSTLIAAMMSISIVSCGEVIENSDENTSGRSENAMREDGFAAGDEAEGFQTDENGETVKKTASLSDFEHDYLSYEGVVNSCALCENAMKHRLAVEYAVARARDSDRQKALIYLEKCEEFEQLLYGDMQHNCTADVIYVTDYPLAVNHYDGMYTGYWQGGGPAGQGEFAGTDITNGAGYCYSGDWKYGLPDGNGTSYEEYGYGGNITYYTGEFSGGRKNGTGLMSEQIGDIMFRYFDQGTFVNDEMTSVTDFVAFDTNNDLHSVGSMTKSGDYLDYVTYKTAAQLKGEMETAIGLSAWILGLYTVDKYMDKQEEAKLGELAERAKELNISTSGHCAATLKAAITAKEDRIAEDKRYIDGLMANDPFANINDVLVTYEDKQRAINAGYGDQVYFAW